MAKNKRRNKPARVDRPTIRKSSLEQTVLARSIESSYSGPIPPANQFAAYEEALPGAGDRILKMAEKQVEMAELQGRHRQDIERKVIYSGASRAMVGLWLSAVVTVCALALSTWLIVNGNSPEGIAAILLTFLTHGVVFVYGKRSQEQERRERRNEVSA